MVGSGPDPTMSGPRILPSATHQPKTSIAAHFYGVESGDAWDLHAQTSHLLRQTSHGGQAGAPPGWIPGSRLQWRNRLLFALSWRPGQRSEGRVLHVRTQAAWKRAQTQRRGAHSPLREQSRPVPKPKVRVPSIGYITTWKRNTRGGGAQNHLLLWKRYLTRMKTLRLTNSETYQYFDLPFCRPEEGLEHKPEALGSLMDGNRLILTKYELKFKEDTDSNVLCSKILTPKDLAAFRQAVQHDYYFQMYYDDLPIWGFVGRVEKITGASNAALRHYIFTHLHFDISYNGDRVIEVNVATDSTQIFDITEPRDGADSNSEEVQFTYSVAWRETDITFDKRMDKYSKYSFLPQHLEIHWFSIINSCVTVLLLTGLLTTILMRILKNDFLKYTRDDSLLEDSDDSGWKNVHGDVFRFPANTSLLAAIIGSGYQLLTLAICVFALALVGVFYPYNRGALFTALVVLYALTAGIAGHVSASYFSQFGGKNWVRNVLLTCFIFCGPLLILFSFLNTVAIVYHSTAALPFGTICVILIIWFMVTFPLTVLGGITGKNMTKEFQAPCRTAKYPREIPPLPWYRSTVPQMVLAGFLPFSAIYVELYYIFASIWGYKVYTIYSILSIVFVILILVTAFVTVALTYFQLAAEDHRWWWRSVMCGGSTAFFIYAYCFYFYFNRSDMSGFMQTTFYFGYMGIVSYGFFLMLGTVGFRASLLFVKQIYKAIKCE